MNGRAIGEVPETGALVMRAGCGAGVLVLALAPGTSAEHGAEMRQRLHDESGLQVIVLDGVAALEAWHPDDAQGGRGHAATCRDVACTCDPDGADRCDYRLLADTVIEHLDVRHDDAAEVALCATAVEEAATGLPGALVAARAALRNIALGLGGDLSVAADEALTRIRMQFAMQFAAHGAPPDVTPVHGRPGYVDVTCGKCEEQFTTNCDLTDDICCPECGAHRCPECDCWFGGDQ